jgi:hypothetical protein
MGLEGTTGVLPILFLSVQPGTYKNSYQAMAGMNGWARKETVCGPNVDTKQLKSSNAQLLEDIGHESSRDCHLIRLKICITSTS